jgi:hypothetical protein
MNPYIFLFAIPSIGLTDMNILTRKQTKAFYDRFGSKQDKQAFYEDPATRVLIEQATLIRLKRLLSSDVVQEDLRNVYWLIIFQKKRLIGVATLVRRWLR